MKELLDNILSAVTGYFTGNATIITETLRGVFPAIAGAVAGVIVAELFGIGAFILGVAAIVCVLVVVSIHFQKKTDAAVAEATSTSTESTKMTELAEATQ